MNCHNAAYLKRIAELEQELAVAKGNEPLELSPEEYAKLLAGSEPIEEAGTRLIRSKPPAPGWNAIATNPPPVGVEVLVCREGVDANTRATRDESGEWTIGGQIWCQIEANAIKRDNRGKFTPTHWWHSEPPPAP
jgi:hypothetical protein